MKLLFATMFVFSMLTCSCQVHWDKTTNWKLYRYQGNDLFGISVDSLSALQHIALAQDSMDKYLSQFNVKEYNPSTRWMGGYIATCEAEGGTRKVVVSNYGGFIYDQKARTYYQLPTEEIDPWLSFLHDSYMEFVKRRQ